MYMQLILHKKSANSGPNLSPSFGPNLSPSFGPILSPSFGPNPSPSRDHRWSSNSLPYRLRSPEAQFWCILPCSTK